VPTEIKLLSSTAMKTSFDELLPQFEAATGHQVTADYCPSPRVAKRIAEGEACDAAVSNAAAMKDLVGHGKIVAGTPTDIARSAMGLAVQKGAPKPDISTAEKFKAAMLAAKSLGMSNPVGGGVSGAILIRAFERLGIMEAMKDKLTFGPGGPAGLIGNFLVRKEVEVGIQQMPELMAVPGIDIVGPLPEGIQSVSVFTIGASTGAKDPDAAKALIKFLASPDAAAMMRAKGLETG
jgi:molybdate transport system substrate-binding protein